MRKIQVLFPEPQMARLREAAAREDRPISEIIRRATEAWLDRRSARYDVRAESRVPDFRGGRILIGAGFLREAARADRFGTADQGEDAETE